MRIHSASSRLQRRAAIDLSSFVAAGPSNWAQSVVTYTI
jgi:hypothetical protein